MKKLIVFVSMVACALSAHAASTTTTSTSTQDVHFAQQIITNGVTPPRVLIHPEAAYTDEARRRGIEGKVIVQAHFDENGNVTVLKVVRGLGYGLDENALAALKDWRFAPALRDGLPVSAVAEIEVPFKLIEVAPSRFTFKFSFSFNHAN